MVCANDETALGLMIGALGRGLRVPDDLAITGFDDMPMAALVRPGLTTVRQPIRELADDHGPTARRPLDRAGRRRRAADRARPARLVRLPDGGGG